MSSRFSSNCEAFASELLENLEDMFPRCMVSVTAWRRFQRVKRRVNTLYTKINMTFVNIVILHFTLTTNRIQQ